MAWRGSAWCRHWRIEGHCEDCAYLAAQERGAPLNRAAELDNGVQPAAPVLADEDVVIPRPDEPSVGVLVLKGEPIPRHLVDLPRVPLCPPTGDRAPGGARLKSRPAPARR